MVTIVHNKVEGVNQKQNEDLIKELSYLVEKVKNDRWVIIGDFNTHSGEDLNVN